MKLTKEDKQMLRKEYGKFWSTEKMVDHCVKSASGYMWLDDILWVIDKPHIETSFWFGEHTWDYDEVVATRNAASESEEYFKRENFDRMKAHAMLELLVEDEDGYVDGEAYVVRKQYYSQTDDCRLGYVATLRKGVDPEEYFKTRYGMQEYRKLTAAETEELKGFLDDEVAKFGKRLDSYLKRYGLSKCSFGVYWADR